MRTLLLFDGVFEKTLVLVLGGLLGLEGLIYLSELGQNKGSFPSLFPSVREPWCSVGLQRLVRVIYESEPCDL